MASSGQPAPAASSLLPPDESSLTVRSNELPVRLLLDCGAGTVAQMLADGDTAPAFAG